MMGKKQANDSAPLPCFEESLEMLEAVVADLEDGKLSLTDALARYEEGVKHLKLCYQSLRDVERKIELLAGVDAEGRPVTQPFDDDATTLEEKRASRSRRRSASPVRPLEEGSDDMDDAPGLF